MDSTLTSRVPNRTLLFRLTVPDAAALGSFGGCRGRLV